MVFIGIVGPFYALMFPNRKRAIAILILYLITVVIEAILQPYLVPYPPITPLINIVFFVAQFSVVITGVLLYAKLLCKSKHYTETG